MPGQNNGTDLATEIYKAKIENFRFYLTHMIKMLILYLSVIGVVIKFALDKNSNIELFYVLMIFGSIFCMYAEYVRKIHYSAIEKLDSSIKELAKRFQLEDYTEDCENFSKFVFSLQFFNYAILLGFIFLMINKCRPF